MAIHKVDGVDGDANFPKKFVRLNITLAASGTITKGQWVSIDTGDSTNGLGGSVKLAPATSLGAVGVVGVAAETITNPSGSDTLSIPLKVQTAGKFENAYVTTDVAASVGIVVDTTPGRADIAEAADKVSPCGMTLEVAVAHLADVMIYDRNMF